ncbi:hypothetical protein KAH37_06425 [bacterium]|nr:hypothetical protein [bacterium]
MFTLSAQRIESEEWEKHFSLIATEKLVSESGKSYLQLFEGVVLVTTIAGKIPLAILPSSYNATMELLAKRPNPTNPLISVIDLSLSEPTTIQTRYHYAKMTKKVLAETPIKLGIVIAAPLMDKIIMKLASCFISHPLFFVKTDDEALAIIKKNISIDVQKSVVETEQRPTKKKDEKEIIYAAIIHHLSTLKLETPQDKTIGKKEMPPAAQEVIDSFSLFKEDIKSLSIEKKEQEIDLTKSIERTKELAAQRAQFLRSLNHQIRTPMTGIFGTLSLLKETKTTEEQAEYFETISASTAALMEMVDKVIAIADAESGTLKVTVNQCDVKKIISDTIRLFSAKAEEANLTVQTDFHESTPAFIISDAGKIKQIITNLLNNAILYTKKGGITISTSFKESALVINVTDSGPGISKADQETIFDQFVRGKTSIGQQGSGLGLSIVSHLASLLGGSITLESREGRGSTFSFILPLDDANIK